MLPLRPVRVFWTTLYIGQMCYLLWSYRDLQQLVTPDDTPAPYSLPLYCCQVAWEMKGFYSKPANYVLIVITIFVTRSRQKGKVMCHFTLHHCHWSRKLPYATFELITFMWHNDFFTFVSGNHVIAQGVSGKNFQKWLKLTLKIY